MKELFETLNQKQKQAVTAPLGPVLVLAGAGSGKTRVLTYRIAYLIAEKLFAPEEILALTFTNKAAGEMRARLDKLLGEKVGTAQSAVRPALSAGTFHSICARLLRSEIENLGRGYNRNFVIYDANESLGLVKQIILEMGLSDKFRPQVFSYYISAAKNRLVSPNSLRLDNTYLQNLLNDVYESYRLKLQDSNALDFDDLLTLTCDLFAKHPAILKKYQEKFKYVLVDEYQDTNHAQYTILKLLVKKHNNLFVVGDDAQSIYGFRGANMQNILDFQKDYPNSKVVMLEQNYRSTQSILDTAHHVIKLNPMQYEKKLWTESEGGSKVNLYEANDEVDESEFVVRQILGNSIQLVSEEEPEYSEEQGGNTPIFDQFLKRVQARTRQRRPWGVRALEMPPDLSQTVILYRTHAQSRPFEEMLLSASIPYQIIGGIKFYERKEIKDVLSYLRLVVNSRDLVSLARVINSPARGIGAVTLRDINASLAKFDYNYERLHLNLDQVQITPKALSGAKDFFGLYVGLAEVPKDTNLLEIMELLLARSGYKDNLLADGEEGAVRWENIEELFNVAGKYKRMPWQEAVSAFLQEVALMTDLDSTDDSENKLTLMTLHSAKGLEFDKVFFVGLEEGLLPHSRSLMNPQELAEEVRLAYVGITRARKDLYLSYAKQRQTYGELKRAVPSRILKAIPKKLINKISNN